MAGLQFDHTVVPGAVVVSAAVSVPVVKTIMVDVPGAHGSLDLSTALTGGAPLFEMRTLEANILVWGENPEARLAELLARWHGQMADINVDGGPGFWRGRVNLLGGQPRGCVAGVALSAMVDPWRLDDTDSVTTITASTSGTSGVLPATPFNVAPTVRIAGTGLTLAAAGRVWQVKAGFTGLLDGLRLSTAGPTPVTLTGTGSLTFTWREGVLL